MSVPLIFDDASTFPPGNLSLAEAQTAHRIHRDAAYADLVGPLVVSFPDLAHVAGPLDVAVVVSDAEAAAAALDPRGQSAGVRVVAVEVADSAVGRLRAAIGQPDCVTVYLEVPRDERRFETIDSLAGTSYRAKLRTGGVRAELYPDEAELAEAVVALCAAGVPFKATAGLHHALRNTDPETGFEQHGFLNLLAATEVALLGGDAEEVASMLAERDARSLPPFEGASLLRSIGTCSIADPVAELTELGLLTLAEV